MPEGKQTLLIVDPESYTWAIAQLLLGPEFHLVHCKDYAQGLKTVHRFSPRAIVCDDWLDNGEGLAFRNGLKAEPVTRDIPFILVSTFDPSPLDVASADSIWLRKDLLVTDLVHTVNKALPAESAPISGKAILSINLHDTQSGLCLVSGPAFLVKTISPIPLAECRQCLAGVSDWTAPNWATSFDTSGSQLYSLLFRSTELHQVRADLLKLATPNEVFLQFAAPKEFVGIPLELLSNPSERSPLALRHPLSRAITGIFLDRPPLSRKFFERLGSRKLRILLIGSNPTPQISISAGEEIRALTRTISASFRRRGVAVDITAVEPADASLDYVLQELQKPKWDIIHYAGHGEVDDQTGDYLPFYQRTAGRNQLCRLTAKELQGALMKSSASFVYLNCCNGSEILGSSLIEAGIPAVLMFRSKHPGDILARFAETFYRQLAIHQDLDTTLLSTRGLAAGDKHMEKYPLWASSTLIQQS